MKPLITLILILFLKTMAIGRPDSGFVKYTLLQELDHNTVSVYSGKYKYYDSYTEEWKELEGIYEVIIIFKNTKKNDTSRVLRSEGVYTTLEACHLSAIQIKGKGQKGIALTMDIKESSNLGEHGNYIVKKTVSEIWDIKEQKRIFSAVNKYSYNSDYTDFPTDSTVSYYETHYSYSYNFGLSNDGRIIVDNLKRDFKVEVEDKDGHAIIKDIHHLPEYCSCDLPDNKEGTYIYKEGQYILE